MKRSAVRAVPKTEQAKVQASDKAKNDEFGYAVAIDGDTAVVGAYFEDEDAAGSNTKSEAGSAYVFVRNGSGVWSQQAKLVASDRNNNDQFGFAVGVSGDTIVVGARYEDEDAGGENTLTSSGSAYVFKRTGAVWAQEAKLAAADRAGYDYFGWSVGIDRDTVVVGAYYEDHDAGGAEYKNAAGSAYVFTRHGTEWSQQQKLVASDRYGYTLSPSSYAGYGDQFGHAVAINGDTIVVGARYEDHDADGENSKTNAGSAYVFVRNGSGVWSQQQKIVAGDRRRSDDFGWSVAVDADTVIVGARYQDYDAGDKNSKSDAGAAYIFTRTGSTWSQQQKIVASDRASGDYFGHAVAVDGDAVIVGAYGEDDGLTGVKSLVGAVYVFTRAGTVWSQQKKLGALDGGAGDYLGFAVGFSGDTVVAGAYRQDTGFSNAGAAYFFVTADGVCDNTKRNSCRVGTADDAAEADDTDQYKWRCTGEAGADDSAVCSVLKSKVKVGVCDNAVRFGCSVGEANIASRAAVGTNWEWKCDGPAGGSLSPKCSMPRADVRAVLKVEEGKVQASDKAASDQFGYAVAIDGDTAVVGARYEDEDASGGNNKNNAGAAYIFTRTNSVWSQQAKLVASDRAANDHFGSSVAVDGDTVVVGAWYEDHNADGEKSSSAAGAAYVFTRSGSSWSQQQKLVALDRSSYDEFGFTVAIDRDTIVVGAPKQDGRGSSYSACSSSSTRNYCYGAVYVFTRYGNSWTQQEKLIASDRYYTDQFGYSVAIDGDTVVAGAWYEDHDADGENSKSSAGSAYIFTRSGSSWSQQQKIVASDRDGGDRFGHSVGVEGNTVIVGAYAEDEDADGNNSKSAAGSAYIFTRSGSSWSQEEKLVGVRSDGW